MRSLALPGAALAGVILAGLIGYAQHPGAPRDGRIIFVPGDEARPTIVDATLPAVSITRCEPEDKGLLVEGRVVPDPPATAVLVTDTAGGTFSVAVGASRAQSAGLIDNAVVGDFQVVLPWATPDSVFAVADPDSLGPEQSLRRGPEATCP